MNTSTQPIDDFHAALGAYLVWTKKSQGAAIEDRSRKVRYELYRQFRRLAKSAGGLRAEVESLGYAIKRRVNGQLAAQYPGAAAVGAVPRVSVEDEIKARIRSLRYLSVSWLFPGWKGAANGQDARYSARNRAQAQIGGALLATAEGRESPYVMLTSFLQGVVTQDARRRITDSALTAQAADMQQYIARKHQEKLASLFRAPFTAVISA